MRELAELELNAVSGGQFSMYTGSYTYGHGDPLAQSAQLYAQLGCHFIPDFNGYVDFNMTLGVVGGVSAGLIFDGNTYYLYAGVGAMTSPGVAATYSPGSMAEGPFTAIQGGLFGAVLSAGGSALAGYFGEAGVGTPGASMTYNAAVAAYQCN